MIKLSIKTNFADVIKKVKQLQDGIRDKAMVSAVNKVAAQAKTAMSKEIGAEFNLKAGKIKDALRVRKARYERGAARIEAVLESPSRRGRSLNVISFEARQVAAGVSVKIKRSAGRKVIKSAFIANKGRTVFQRVGKERLPIKAVQTIEVAQMFNTKRINAKVVRFVEEKLPSVLQHELRFQIDKFNQGKR
jgi:Prophage minor tail protein Z (GPZ)